MPTQSWGHSLSLWESWRWYGFVRRFSGRLAPEWSTRLPEIQARAWRNRSCSMVCALAEPWIWVLHPTEHKHRSCSTELFCSQEQNKTFFFSPTDFAITTPQKSTLWHHALSLHSQLWAEAMEMFSEAPALKILSPDDYTSKKTIQASS